MSYIPQFEFDKDSYIIKHKLDYNTSCNNGLSGENYGILFTDYDLARKTQSKNAEVFSNINIDLDVEDISIITINKYDISHSISLFGKLFEEELVSVSTFTKTNNYEEYSASSSLTSLSQIGDLFNIYFHTIEEITGTTTWSHFGPSGETWVVYGTTENGISFQVTGTTTQNGYSSGTTTYEVEDYKPILKYSAKVIGKNSSYIRFEKKIEDFFFNNIISLSEDNDLYYKLESLHYSDDSYQSVKYILEESNWDKYFDINASDSNLILTPIPNKEDLYFDYDNVDIIVSTTTSEYTYKFETNCLYVKYKLDRFLEQFNFNITGTSIYYDNICDTNLYTPSIDLPTNGLNYMYKDVYLNDVNDISYFKPFTYVYMNTDISTYTCLILDIQDNILKLKIPLGDINNGENILSVQNLHIIEDISNILYYTFINIDYLYIDDYRSVNDQQRMYIYSAYSYIIKKLDLNSQIRDIITGIIYENENKVFTLKIYRPNTIVDKRLTYVPIEIVKIGVNNKTTIPVKLVISEDDDSWNFNLIDPNLDGFELFDSIDSFDVIDSNI